MDRTPDRTGRVNGRVFDESTGREIAGAFVSLESGRKSHQTLTSPEGNFLFSSIEAGSYRLAVDAGGFLPEIQNLQLAARTQVGIDVGLRPASTKGDLTGIVLDAASGARLGSAVLSVPFENATTFADSSGRFTFRNVDAGEQLVEVRAVGHAPFSARVSIPAGGVVVETFRLAANAGSIEGTVTSTSQVFATRPLAGALVKLMEPARNRPAGFSLSYTPSSTRAPSLVETGIVTRSGADGRYRLDNVTAGVAGLMFQAASHDELIVTTTVLLGRVTRADAPMRFNRATLSGRVTDLSSAPVAGASVSVPESGLTTRTDQAGRYQLVNSVVVRDFPRIVVINGFPVQLPAHTTPVGATAAGFRITSTLVSFVAGGSVQLDFVLGRSTGNLIGRVERARDGTPVGGAVVSLPQLGLTTPVAGTGEFAFTDLPASFLAVQANAVGFLPATTFVNILPDQTATGLIRMVAPGRLTGTVRGLASQAPIQNARVLIVALSRAAFTDAGGLYNFNELAPGTYQLEVSAAGKTTDTTRTATITDGGTTTVNVSLRP